MHAEAIYKRFRDLYPSSEDPRMWRAPGRINLIGEHTDYNHGLVLPMAIDLACFVAAAPSNDGWLRVFSEQLEQGAQWRVDEIASSIPQGGWSDRAAGIAWALARRGVPISGQNVLITSTVPIGGGLSSSAAMGVALALALGGERNPLELAHLARAAEMNFAGVPCGIMDQFISTHGIEGSAILLDCRSLEWHPLKLPEDLAIVSANSMVKHELGNSAYRTRVEECVDAARIMGVGSLREATADSLSMLDGVLLKRARHVVTENQRVEDFRAATERGDLKTMGRLVTESHNSLRDDYEVSCPELDFLVETALRVPGVWGARMTGGGFGGSTINLVRREAVEEFESTLISSYRQNYGQAPEIHRCIPSSGAGSLAGRP